MAITTSPTFLDELVKSVIRLLQVKAQLPGVIVTAVAPHGTMGHHRSNRRAHSQSVTYLSSSCALILFIRINQSRTRTLESCSGGRLATSKARKHQHHVPDQQPRAICSALTFVEALYELGQMWTQLQSSKSMQNNVISPYTGCETADYSQLTSSLARMFSFKESIAVMKCCTVWNTANASSALGPEAPPC